MRKSRILLFGALAVGFVLRCANIASSAVNGRLFPFDSDPAYHLRRIFMFIHNFPHLPTQDPFLAFPRAAQVQWPPLFDGFCALLYLPFSLFSQSPVAFEWFLALVIPLLAVLVIFLCYLVAKRLFGRHYALVATWVLALIPSHIFISMFGRIDHHIIEHLFLVLTLLWATRFFKPQTNRHLKITSLLLVANILMMVLSAPMIYYAYFTYVTVSVFAFSLSKPQEARPVLRAYLGTWLLVVIVSIIGIAFSSLWQRFDPWDIQIPGRFWLCYAALTLFATATLFYASALKATRWHRLVAWAAGLATVACVAILAQKQGMQVIAHIIQRNDYNFLLVEENNGLFSNGIGYYLPFFFEHITAIGLIAGVGLFLLGRNLRRQGTLPHYLLFTLACGTALQSLVFVRFLPTAAIFVALLVAYTASELQQLFAFDRRLLKNPLMIATALLIGVSIVSGIRYVQNLLNTDIHYPRELMSVLTWIKTSTPPPVELADDSWNPQAKPRYGIVAHGAYGGFLTYYAERPTLDSPFDTDTTHASRRDALAIRLATDETTAWQQIQALGVRYLLTFPDLLNYANYEKILSYGKSITTPQELLNPTSIQYLETRLHLFDGSFAFYQNKTLIPALQHLRLVYQSRENRQLWQKDFPTYKVFEALPGAHLTFDKPLTTGALIELPFHDYENRQLVYRSYLPAGSTGTIVPYASRFNNGVIIVDSAYQITAKGKTAHFEVDESAVQLGSEIKFTIP